MPQLSAETAEIDLVEMIRVGMSEMKIVTSPSVLITTVGSCVALCMYDSKLHIGGMAHIVLPTNESLKDNDSPFKFADTAVPALASALISRGASRRFIKAKIAGGANMFPMFDYNVLNIGKNNVAMVKNALFKENIPLVAEDVGGTYGRKVEFSVASGKLRISTISGEVKVL